MSYSSHVSSRSLQCPYHTDKGNLALGYNCSCNTNPGLYHPDYSPKVFGLHPSLPSAGFSGNDLRRTANTSVVDSPALQYLLNCDAQDFYVQFSNHYPFLGGMGGDTMSWAPSNEPKAELKDTSLTPFTPEPPKQAQGTTTARSIFLDVKSTLLPEISPHLQEAVDHEGRRQWHCTFPHCTRSSFSRRDRAETHVAGVHLKKKSVYCKGSCGTIGW